MRKELTSEPFDARHGMASGSTAWWGEGRLGSGCCSTAAPSSVVREAGPQGKHVRRRVSVPRVWRVGGAVYFAVVDGCGGASDAAMDSGSDATMGPSCTDGVRNGMETDVGCGGPTCSPCARGMRCASDADCSTGSCRRGACVVCTTSMPSISASGTCPPSGGLFCGSWGVRRIRVEGTNQLVLDWEEPSGECGLSRCSETLTFSGVTSCS